MNLPAVKLKRLRFLPAFVLFFICFSARPSTDSAWFARAWKTDDGLPNNNIRQIVQGPDNYLWVVTPVDLMRFDGVQFSPFPVKNFPGVTDSHVRMVLCDLKGVLWIVPYNGPVIGLNPDLSATALPDAVAITNAPTILAEDGNGSFWLGYSDVICRIQRGHLTGFDAKDGVPEGDLHSLIADGDGNIWLAKGNKLCVFQNGRFRKVATARGVRCLAATHTNAVWFVSRAHLYACSTDGVLQDYGAFQNPFDAPTKALLEDRSGAVWIGTDGNGLFRSQSDGFDRIETSHSSISSITEDHEGNIWVSTAGGGVNRISLSGVRQEFLEDRFDFGQIQSICEDTNGLLWGATHNGVLISRNHGQWNRAFTNAPFAGTVTCVAAGVDGSVWAGTRNGKLFRVADTNYIGLDQSNGLIGQNILSLLPTRAGDLWIVGHRVQCLHDGRLRNINLPTQIGRVSAVTEDAAGNIWFGAKGAVVRFDGNNFVDETAKLGVPIHTVSCLYATTDGSVWISGGDIGLLRFKDGRASRVDVEQGLYDNHISQIAADDQGWLWFAGDRGIFKIRQLELEQALENHNVLLRPVVYGKNEDLTSLEAVFSADPPYVIPNAVRSHDGGLWFLMHSGIVSADPKISLESPSPPPVLVTRMAMDGRTIASYGGFASTQMVANLKALNIQLKLPPSHRHLEFDFTAFHFRAPENIRFHYKLGGYDDDWVDAETERNANYSRLKAGNYQFRVAACVGDGPWSEPATLSFAVMPFVWETWWFRLGALLLFTSAIIAVVRYISVRRIRAQMRLLEQRAALDKERARIARDLHDDLGCSLNKVALTLDMMQNGSPLSRLENADIGHCSAMIRDAAQSVDEIVWAINPRNDTLRYMVDFISQSASEFLQAADIPCLIELPDTVPDRMVSPEVRHNLLLVVKEALNNVARHARAGEVRLSVDVSETHVIITVQDNGCGFERAPDNASCDGLRNMRQRMEEIGGEFQLESRPGAGTRVLFRYSSKSKTTN